MGLTIATGLQMHCFFETPGAAGRRTRIVASLVGSLVNLKSLPAKGDKLFREGKEVGYITSALASPRLGANIALGYVRKEVNQVGTELVAHSPDGEVRARIVELPFAPSPR